MLRETAMQSDKFCIDVKYQLSNVTAYQCQKHINVKCQVSCIKIKCRMSNQLILEISVDLMIPQKILGDLSRSHEIL